MTIISRLIWQWFFLSGEILVLLNNGNASFVNGGQYIVGPGGGPQSLAIGDLNGDGRNDLAVTVAEVGGTPETVQTLLNQGDGTFSAGVSFEVGVEPDFVGIGNLDNTLEMDFVVVNTASDTISAF